MKNFGEFYNNQIENAGAVILSRTQKLSEEKQLQAAELIREQNPNAVVITTPWDELKGEQILAAMEHQDLIMKAWADARNEVTEKYPDPDETYIQKCEEAGMTVVTPENEKFIELAKPAVEKWAAENGAEDILTLINNTQ